MKNKAETADSEDEEELSLTFNDFLESMHQMKKMGGMSRYSWNASGNGALAARD